MIESKHNDPEIVSLIDKCSDIFTDDSSKLAYLMSVLCYKKHQGKTIKEVFQSELKSKEEFNQILEQKK